MNQIRSQSLPASKSNDFSVKNEANFNEENSVSLLEKLLVIEKCMHNNDELMDNAINLIDNDGLYNYKYNIKENKNIELKRENFLAEKELERLKFKNENFQQNLTKRLGKDYQIFSSIIQQNHLQDEDNINEDIEMNGRNQKIKYVPDHTKCSYYFYDEFMK